MKRDFVGSTNHHLSNIKGKLSVYVNISADVIIHFCISELGYK